MKKLCLLLVGLILTAGLIWQADWQQVQASLANASPDLLLAVCLLQILTILAINYQWRKISRLIAGKGSFGQMLFINMQGTIVESVTPAVKAGGEVVKALLLKNRVGLTGGEAMAVVSLQKAISMFSFLCLTVGGLVWFFFTAGFPGVQGKIMLGGLGLLGAVLLLLLLVLIYPEKIARLLEKFPLKKTWQEKLAAGMADFRQAAGKAGGRHKFLLAQVAFSCFIWLLYGYKTYLLTKSLGLELGLLPVTVVTFLSYLVAMIPITPGGLGTFEGTMVFLLLPLGITAGAGMSLALLTRLLTFWFVFLFGLVYLGGVSLLGWLDRRAISGIGREATGHERA